MPRQPRQEFAQPIGSFESLPVWFELDPGVEIPADQHDALACLQHRRLGMADVVRRIDDACQPIRLGDLPAGLAGRKNRWLVATGSTRREERQGERKWVSRGRLGWWGET